ncbi:MAG: YkgJ family cysteine cluster protein [Myxococcaceae bacterium]
MSSVGELCQACALCCDGTLFARVSVTETEAAVLQRSGLATELRAKNKRVLPQPCAALQGSRCGCYADRPGPCREYVCLLATALEDGEVTHDGALKIVEEARRRSSALAAKLQPGEGPLMRRAREQADLSVEVREALGFLEAHLRRHFLGVAGARGRER